MSSLSVKVTKRLPGFELDVSWRVPAGFSVLFGYSGAGKSLTISALAGTMKPDAGVIRLGDETWVDTSAGVYVAPQRRGIGYVSQSSELFPHMSVVWNVEFALKGVGRRERHERAMSMLESMRIADLAQKRPGEISGGQRQRAALARALAPEPRLLLLDEPLSALDLPVRVEMRRLLRAVQRERGIPVVMVTHDLYEAMSLADSLVVYSGTGVVQVGSPRELLSDPGTPEIRRLLHAIEVPTALLDPDRQ